MAWRIASSTVPGAVVAPGLAATAAKVYFRPPSTASAALRTSLLSGATAPSVTTGVGTTRSWAAVNSSLIRTGMSVRPP